MNHIHAVIMAGGQGERLWPLSTLERPKQFLKFRGKQTMLQETVARIRPLISKENVHVVAPKVFTELILEQLDIPSENVIAEPVGRNTAPCIGLAAIMLEAKDPQGVMVVLPADHVIQKAGKFLEILGRAIEVASSGTRLVTLGIVPDHPATGYGYIHCGGLFAKMDETEVYNVRNFTEKPDEETAKQLLKRGDYYWNSGMFIWRVDTILAEIERHMPVLYAGLLKIKAHLGEPDLNVVIAQVHREQAAISIDYGVMEQSSNVLMLPMDVGWNDVGDWSALDVLFDKDKDGNVVRGPHIGLDTTDSVIFAPNPSDKRIIVTIGLENVVIVDTDEALLVMDKKRAQRVKEVLGLFGDRGGT